jgi:hypothetical protein
LTQLGRPALCDEFCKEYTRRHTNRLRGEGNAQHKMDKAALAKIERELDRLVQPREVLRSGRGSSSPCWDE